MPLVELELIYPFTQYIPLLPDKMFSESFLKVKPQQFKKQEWLYQTKYSMKNLSGEKTPN